MNALHKSLENFLKMGLRERLLAVLAVALVLYFIMDVALLGPQQKKIKQLQQLNNAHQTELVLVSNALDEFEKNTPAGVDPRTMNRAALDEIKKQIADADALFGEVDTNTSQTGTLVKKLLDANPGLTLLSLNTLPTTPFYTIENKPAGSDAASKAPPVVAPNTIYSYGVEISVKGNYMALLSYMESLRKYPKRLFWSDTNLDVDVYPNAVLKMAVYSLSAQPSSPLR
jgi:MSHA biogenesis protein MshJ